MLILWAHHYQGVINIRVQNQLCNKLILLWRQAGEHAACVCFCLSSHVEIHNNYNSHLLTSHLYSLNGTNDFSKSFFFFALPETLRHKKQLHSSLHNTLKMHHRYSEASTNVVKGKITLKSFVMFCAFWVSWSKSSVKTKKNVYGSSVLITQLQYSQKHLQAYFKEVCQSQM